MTDPIVERSEVFLRFSRRSMAAMLAVVVLLGGTGLILMLTPTGEVWRIASRASLVLVVIAVMLTMRISMQRRQWAPDAPEVKLAMQDEWRRTNMLRASRVALLAVLFAQYPLSLMLGFLTPLAYTPPRVAMAMAASTVVIGLTTLISLFLYWDREE